MFSMPRRPATRKSPTGQHRLACRGTLTASRCTGCTLGSYPGSTRFDSWARIPTSLSVSTALFGPLGLEQKRRLVALAEADGLSASELVRRLIDLHIEDRAANYRALASIFGDAPTSPKE